MKFLKKIVSVSFVLIIVLVSHQSCVRERDTDMSLVEEQTMGEFIYHNAFEIAEDAASKSSGELLSNFKTAGYCATIVHNKLANPRTISIDFGNVNCPCNDSRNRKGKINVSYTGTKFTDSNSVTTISFDNYFVDNYQVFGTSITNHKGRNLLSQPYFEMLIDGKFIKPNTLDTLKWNATRTRTWTKGSTNVVYGDDEYELVGNGTGTGVNRGFYSMNITTPIIKSASCRFFIKGKLDIQPQGKSLRMVNYGKGECDDKATIELNTKTFSIQL